MIETVKKIYKLHTERKTNIHIALSNMNTLGEGLVLLWDEDVLEDPEKGAYRIEKKHEYMEMSSTKANKILSDISRLTIALKRTNLG